MPLKYSFLLVPVMLASTLTNYEQAVYGASPSASGQTTTVQKAGPIVKDVALGSDGLLRGQIIDATFGNEEKPAEIILYQNQQPVAQIVCNEKGQFCSEPIPTGMYVVVANNRSGMGSSMMVRIWAHGTAPPSAVKRMVLSGAEQTVYRGQFDWPSIRGVLFRNQWVTAALIGAAIAVPIAVTYEKDSSS